MSNIWSRNMMWLFVYSYFFFISENSLTFNHGGNELKLEFLPHRVYMSPENGRVYHPAESQYGSIGLIRSKMAIEFSKHFDFEQGEHKPPTHFTWNNTRYTLENEWMKDIKLPTNRTDLWTHDIFDKLNFVFKFIAFFKYWNFVQKLIVKYLYYFCNELNNFICIFFVSFHIHLCAMYKHVDFVCR